MYDSHANNVAFISVYQYTTCRTGPHQPFGSIIKWNIMMMIKKTMTMTTDDDDDALNFGTFHLLSVPPLRMTGFWIGGAQIISSNKPTKFGPFGQVCQRCREKKVHFGFYFLKGAHKNLRVRIPVILRRDRANKKKWNVLFAHNHIHLS